ncbi:DUF3089 domain-containing protein [Novosphingobium lentum]|uniref:DUF3089 domain-containing protein n=1 Tax=Novosphingobium lentum TaxID=145287 RepID=UPI0008365BE7|nr:DUF3089 domain-containing protein [Novosphingobium lentum]
MARKFLYLVAILIVLVIGSMAALQLFPDQLTRFAFVPKGDFEPQQRLASSAYDNPAMWLSHPRNATDPARWLPPGWHDPAGLPASRAVVFFIHPTSYIARDHWNEPLDDATARNRAGLFVSGMASPFNRAAQVWAPTYRQAAIGSFLTDAPAARAAVDLAYRDVLSAFDAFVAQAPVDAPIVLAGHSQGSLHLLHLLKDRVAGKPIARRIIAVYAIGWPISLAHDLPATGLPACTAPTQAGCLASWISFAEPAAPSQLLDVYAASAGLDGQRKGTGAVVCTNPLTGGNARPAPASANLGSLVPGDAKSADRNLLEGASIVPGMVPAHCDPQGLLLIGPPPAMGPYVLPGNNFHLYDIPLFWANLRVDVTQREAAWWAGHGPAR